jgi:FAD:protein FMN transferase
MTVFSPGNHPDLISSVSRPAMATEFVVMLASAHQSATELALSALEMVDEIEQRLTIYRPDSEISRVNRDAASQPVQVSESTYGLIETAIRWSEKTAGRFDVTAGPLVKAWGFTERKGRKPSAGEILEALAVVGYQKLVLDPNERTIAFSVPGMSINLGGIGKGFALDQIAERLLSGGVTDFLIHGGQSSVLAKGNQSANVDRGWAVGIGHPTRSNRRLAGVWLRDAALGTSGSGKQFFHHRGRRFGHVIDPITGYPTTDLVSLTLRAANATDADAAGTGLFLAGSSSLQQTPEMKPESVSMPQLPLFAVRQGARQDELLTEVVGNWDWVEPPNAND